MKDEADKLLLLWVAVAIAGFICFLLLSSGCGPVQFGDTNSNNTATATVSGSTSSTGAYDITITSVSKSAVTDSLGVVVSSSYTISFTDPVAMDTPSIFGYWLEVDGVQVGDTFNTMSGYGSVDWSSTSTGSHMLAIHDGTGRISQPWQITT